MNMSKTIQYNEYIELSDIKPEVSKKGIFFPTSVDHENLNKYHGDARSFGYHYDDGPCTIVKYEQVLGVLAEDTIELFVECEQIKKHMKKPTHHCLEIVQSNDICNKKKAELLIRYDSEFFYKDKHGYFFITKYYDYGTPQRVSNETAEIYREINKEYQRKIKKYNKIMKQALQNIENLHKTLLYK